MVVGLVILHLAPLLQVVLSVVVAAAPPSLVALSAAVAQRAIPQVVQFPVARFLAVVSVVAHCGKDWLNLPPHFNHSMAKIRGVF